MLKGVFTKASYTCCCAAAVVTARAKCSHGLPLLLSFILHLLISNYRELLACYAGLQVAISMGVQEIIVETDTMLVRDALSGDNYRLSTVGGLVTEMNFFISAELRSCNLSVCKRDCNRVAHALAAAGCKFSSGISNTWDGVPQEFECVVTSDLAGVDE